MINHKLYFETAIALPGIYFVLLLCTDEFFTCAHHVAAVTPTPPNTQQQQQQQVDSLLLILLFLVFISSKLSASLPLHSTTSISDTRQRSINVTTRREQLLMHKIFYGQWSIAAHSRCQCRCRCRTPRDDDAYLGLLLFAVVKTPLFVHSLGRSFVGSFSCACAVGYNCGRLYELDETIFTVAAPLQQQKQQQQQQQQR